MFFVLTFKIINYFTLQGVPENNWDYKTSLATFIVVKGTRVKLNFKFSENIAVHSFVDVKNVNFVS